ncbi:MAG: signal peptidase II [Anaerolineaceae bacterium]|nr:signal peptidase II [Anaerolineaceae bacterium]
MKKNLRSYLILFPVAIGIIGVDQWTKALIRNTLAFGEIWSPWDWLTPYARIVHWHNTGVAFGMFQNNNILFAILVSIIALVIIVYYPRLTEGDWFLRIALSMQLGGAVGNLIDRLTIGHVTDFISVGRFAVFNVADASVTVGVGIMILGLWIQENKQKKRKSKEEQKPKEAEKR